MSDNGDDHGDYAFDSHSHQDDPWSSDSFIEAQYMTYIENSLRCLEELDPLQVQVDPSTFIHSDSCLDPDSPLLPLFKSG